MGGQEKEDKGPEENSFSPPRVEVIELLDDSDLDEVQEVIKPAPKLGIVAVNEPSGAAKRAEGASVHAAGATNGNSDREEAAAASPSSSSGEEPPAGSAAQGKRDAPEDATAPLKKRKFGHIRQGQKCGECENCRNPGWKKPCSTVRKAQEAAAAAAKASKSSMVPLSVPEKKAEKAEQPPPPTKPKVPSSSSKPSSSSSEAFTETMSRIMATSGGVTQTSHIPSLIDLMKRAGAAPQRTALLMVLSKSPADVLHGVVQSSGLLTLQVWLSEAVKEQKVNIVEKLLGVLDLLPITLASLQPPCELGKVVGKLRRAAGMDAAHDAAKKLVEKWRAVVQTAETAPIAAVAAASHAAAAKAEAAKAEAEARKIKVAAKLVTGTGKAPAAQPHSPTAAALGEDQDFFSVADKRRAGAAAAAAAAAAVRPAPAAAPSTTAKTAAASEEKAKPAAVKPAADKPATVPVDAVARVSASPFDTPASSAVAAVGASPFSLAPSASLSNSSSLQGPSSLMAFGPPVSAKERAQRRAREAAERVPSPEPGPRKPKRKKLAWVEDAALEAVRWFRREDPPVAAQRDADENAAHPAVAAAPQQPGDVAAGVATPAGVAVAAARVAAAAAGGAAAAGSHLPPHLEPQFASAAKKEHLSEAQALKAHREQETHHLAELQERLDKMQAEIEWAAPPAIANTTHFAAGEDSFELLDSQQRREGKPRVIPYARAEDIPYSPAEPDNYRPPYQPFNYIPRIPLTIAQAQAWAAAAAAQAAQRVAHPPPVPPQQAQQQQHNQQYRYPAAVPPTQQQQQQYHQHAIPLQAQQQQPQHGAALPHVQQHGQPHMGGSAPAPRRHQPPQQQLPKSVSAALGSALPQAQQVQQQQQQQGLQQHGQRPRYPNAVLPQQAQQQPRQPRPAQHQQAQRLPSGLPIMAGLHRQSQQVQQAQQQHAALPPAQHQPQQQQQYQPPPHNMGGGGGSGGGGFLAEKKSFGYPCKFFNTPKGCIHGARCKFSHEGEGGAKKRGREDFDDFRGGGGGTGGPMKHARY